MAEKKYHYEPKSLRAICEEGMSKALSPKITGSPLCTTPEILKMLSTIAEKAGKFTLWLQATGRIGIENHESLPTNNVSWGDIVRIICPATRNLKGREAGAALQETLNTGTAVTLMPLTLQKNK